MYGVHAGAATFPRVPGYPPPIVGRSRPPQVGADGRGSCEVGIDMPAEVETGD